MTEEKIKLRMVPLFILVMALVLTAIGYVAIAIEVRNIFFIADFIHLQQYVDEINRGAVTATLPPQK